jgi:hypothetical protein
VRAERLQAARGGSNIGARSEIAELARAAPQRREDQGTVRNRLVSGRRRGAGEMARLDDAGGRRYASLRPTAAAIALIPRISSSNSLKSND